MPDIYMDVDTAVTVPVNLLPIIASSDFKTILAAETYNEAGLDLVWNFVTTAGVQTHTAITPTDTGGSYDWVTIGHGMYNIELPAAINNTEGFGWFTGVATDALPWRGPVIGFRAAALNDALVDGGDLLDVNAAQVIGTALTETSAGYLAAGIKKLFDVASPVLTAASVNQTGNSYPIVSHADYGNAKLVRSVTPDNALSVDGSNYAQAAVMSWPTLYANAIPFSDDATNLEGHILAMESGTGVVLTDGAIKGSTFDGSTAFPLEAADSSTTALARAAELAKVPKSDSTVSWNATALAAIADAVFDEEATGHTGWLTKLLSVAKFLGLK